MGPHPAVAAVRSAVRDALAAAAAERVLVACSGGADSLALAAAVAFEAPRAGIACGLVTVDHGLQDGSDQQARRVVQVGHDLGLHPVQTVVVTVGRDGGVEAAARTARYAALEATARAWDAAVLLGHTLDDQAETVLLGLGRGSGPRSIAGMRRLTPMLDSIESTSAAPAGRRWWVRPMLGLRRRQTEAACAALDLAPWEDPHNSDPSFRRVRLRREVLPLLEEVLAGGVAEALARTASLVQEDMDALDHYVRDLLGTTGGGGTEAGDHVDATVLAAQPRSVRSRVLRRWAASLGCAPLTAVHTQALDALVTNWHGQGPVDLPGGRRAVRASGKLMLTAAADARNKDV